MSGHVFISHATENDPDVAAPALLAGSRDPALDYDDAAEILLLLERLG